MRVLPIRRLRVRAGLFAALAGIVAIFSALAIVLTGVVGAAATTGVRAELAASAGIERTLQLSLYLDTDDADAQDRAVREVFAESFENGRSLRMDVDRSLLSATRAEVTSAPGGAAPADTRAVLSTTPGLADHATLVDGRWPTAVEEVSVQADAAAELGVEAGQDIRIGGVPVTVTGLWRLDPTDLPRWSGDEQLLTGVTGDGAGPIVIDEALWPELRDEVEARVLWTLTPRIDTVDVADLSGIVDGWNGLPFALRRDGRVDTGDLAKRGRLVATASDLQTRVVSLTAVQPLPLLVIGAVALIALVEFGRLIAVLRARESFLLWSRGAGVGDVTAVSVGEAAAAAVPGTAVGAAGAVGILALLGEGALSGAGSALWLAPVAAALAATGAVGVETWRDLATATSRRQRVPSRRRRRWTGAGAVVLAAAIAALTTWQLLLYGSPLSPAGREARQVDPLAVLAPAAVLVAVVLLLVRLAPLAAPPIERRLARSTGARAALISRSLLRRPALATIPLVLTALAVGQLLTAGYYAQAWNSGFTVTRELRSGADTRLTSPSGALPESLVAPAGTSEGVVALAPAVVDSVGLASEETEVVAVTPATLVELGLDGEGAVDLAATAEAIDAGVPAPVIPAGTRSVEFAVRMSSGADVPAVTVTLATRLGETRELTLTADAAVADAAVTDATALVADLPDDASGPWRIAAIDLAFPGDPAEAPLLGGPETPGAEIPDPVTFEITAITASTASGTDADVELPLTWTAATTTASTALAAALEEGAGVVLSAPGGGIRILPTLGDLTDDLEVPIALSRPLAERLEVGVGDGLPLSLRPGAADLTARVTAVVAAVPGSDAPEAVLVDLELLRAVELRVELDSPTPTTWWVSVENPVTASAALDEALPSGVRVESLADDPARAMLGSAATALWIGALGAVGLAGAAIAAVLGVQRRERVDEERLLSALGVVGGERARMRRRELVIVLVAGLVIGLVAGLAVAALTIGPFVLAAIPGAVVL